MSSAGRDITTITINRHEIPNIQIYPCIGLKMLHSGAEAGHGFVSAREYARSILASGDIRERFNTTSLESCVERKVIVVED